MHAVERSRTESGVLQIPRAARGPTQLKDGTEADGPGRTCRTSNLIASRTSPAS